MRMTAIMTAAIICILTLTGTTTLAVDKRLATARASYGAQLLKIQGGSDNKTDWRADYGRELKALGAAYQTGGDLDGLIAARKEIKRFEYSSEIPAESIVTEPAKLKELQDKYAALAGGGGIEKSRKIVALTELYVAHLEDMKKQLTVSGDIESALAAKKEIERVQASPVNTAALFDLSVAKAAEPKQPVPVEKAATAPAKEDENEMSAPRGYTLYPAGKTPERIAGQVFNRLALASTGNTPMSARRVSVIASRSLASQVSNSSSYYSSSKRTSKSAIIRLQIRHTRSSSAVENQIVNIQFFTKPVGSKGSASPTRVASGTIKIPKLTSAAICVDCPEVSSSSSSYRSGRRTSKRGTAFYGILVSVYNADGTLSYQGISTSGLKKAAAVAKVRSEADILQEQLEGSKQAYDQARAAYYANTRDPALRQEYYAARTAYMDLQQKIRAAR